MNLEPITKPSFDSFDLILAKAGLNQFTTNIL